MSVIVHLSVLHIAIKTFPKTRIFHRHALQHASHVFNSDHARLTRYRIAHAIGCTNNNIYVSQSARLALPASSTTGSSTHRPSSRPTLLFFSQFCNEDHSRLP